MQPASSQIIGTILKHDKKITSYKLALVRALNDVVLSFPDVAYREKDVAVPLRLLAEFWIAYYWPFAEAEHPIIQGQQAWRDGVRRNDLSFRPALTRLRAEWEAVLQAPSVAADGFYLLSEFRSPRRRATYPAALQQAYDVTVAAITGALQQPIRYAGPGQWTIFDKPQKFGDLPAGVMPLPGTRPNEVCVVVKAELWQSFRALSLWIEALSIHEWCLFSERVADESGQRVERGQVYNLLTARPDNRRPLTWERNQVEVLMLEGVTFTCPWTRKVLGASSAFDIDHLLPLAVHPVNELWNLLPADSRFNRDTKRDRLPTTARLATAQPLIAAAYLNYEKSPALRQTVHEDAGVRFAGIPTGQQFAAELARHAVHFIEEVANARSVARF